MRRGNRVVVDWSRPGRRRCGWCGQAVPLFAEAGHGRGRVYCESCFLGRERWRSAMADALAVGRARAMTLSGAA